MANASGSTKKAATPSAAASSSKVPPSSLSPSKSTGKGAASASSSNGKSNSGSSKRRKVGQACIYCRRSHMTCDESRPCKRCIKRDIGHLCHDEAPARPSNASARSTSPMSSANQARSLAQGDHQGEGQSATTASRFDEMAPIQSGSMQQAGVSFVAPMRTSSSLSDPSFAAPSHNLSLPSDVFSSDALGGGTINNWGAATMLGGAGFLGLGGAGPSGIGSGSEILASGDAAGGNEFNILSEFLESLDGTSALPTPQPGTVDQAMSHYGSGIVQQQPGQYHQQQHSSVEQGSGSTNPNAASMPTPSSSAAMQNLASSTSTTRHAHGRNRSQGASLQEAAALAANSKTETFFLTAADQKDGSRDERLGRVIQAKLDAGLLRPYNHVKGYARLNQWMEQYCSQASRRRILKPLSVFRPAFRSIAQRLTNLDLIYIEEAFERLLLDYDRVFSTQGIPACLWRRTGEIYKGNKEFADLVGVSVEALREGKCAIYELMQEDSAVNYWEKYGAVCFDPGQKAVLTSCVLSTRRARRRLGAQGQGNGATQVQAPASADMTTSKSQQSLDKSSGPSASSQSSGSAAAGLLSCCFSFTIRRDAWGIPYAIVGNFMPIPGQMPQVSAATTAGSSTIPAPTTIATNSSPPSADAAKRPRNGSYTAQQLPSRPNVKA